MHSMQDPRTAHRSEAFPAQTQEQPGLTAAMEPEPDHGERSYQGSGRLNGRTALITGGDSGIGRAVAIAFAREGARVALSFLPEEIEDARAAAHWVEEAGAEVLLLPGDLRSRAACQVCYEELTQQWGAPDILVLGAAYQRARAGLADLDEAEVARTFETNLFSQLWLLQAAEPSLVPGASVILTASVQAERPSAGLLDYALTKAAQVALVTALTPEFAERGVRINAVAPGPVWTPLIPATGWPEQVPEFGQSSVLGRAAQPAELAGAYVYLAGAESSFVSGSVLTVDGGGRQQ